MRKRPIHEAILEFKQIRDKRAAHGRSGQRGLTLAQILECQHCAKFIIYNAIDPLTGKMIIDMAKLARCPPREEPRLDDPEKLVPKRNQFREGGHQQPTTARRNPSIQTAADSSNAPIDDSRRSPANMTRDSRPRPNRGGLARPG